MAKDTRLYDLLNISPDSSTAQIKKAYRANALKYHPDKNQHDSELTEKFKEITMAYEVLTDEEKRSIYDKYGEAGLNGEIQQQQQYYSGNGNSMFMNPDDLFSQMFGDAFGFSSSSFFNSSSSRAQKRKGRDIAYNLNCTLEALYNGKTAKLGLSKQVKCKTCNGLGAPRSCIRSCMQCNGKGMEVLHKNDGFIQQRIQRTCARCNGTGQYISSKDRCGECNGAQYYQSREILTIDVPAGARNNESFVMKNKADEGPNIRPGDVIITVREQLHKYFQRLNENLVYTAEIPLLTALTGGYIQIKFLNNKMLNVNIAQGEIINPDDIKVIKNHGMPYVVRDGSTKFGDLIVNFKILFPSKLSPQSYNLLTSALPAESKKRKLDDDSDVEDNDTEHDIENVVFENGDRFQNDSRYSSKRRKAELNDNYQEY